MDSKLQAWRQAGKHLPDILKDFHDQKAIFQAMHEMLNLPDKESAIRQPNFVEGQCYVIDCFLWFMARHGYTLQKSRAKLEFESLEDNVQAIEARKAELLKQILSFEK